MHITLSNFLIVLGVFLYSSAALVWRPTSRLPITVGFQNDLGFDVDAEPTISPTTITDFAPFRPTSVFTLPASVTSNAQSRESHSGCNSRRYIPYGGFNAATVTAGSGGEIITDAVWKPFHRLSSLPVITQHKTYTDIFTNLVPTTTRTVTVTPRDVGELESGVMTAPGSHGWETPLTFQTITGAPSPASSIVPRERERRGYREEDVAFL
ncbi:hypothetical protein DSL72_006464 [Monilinia vaccinii-corymbosi]|uniref:Uncharacterized protein n=1 Tax=Monilinia vaccinii-corymbosi TaxID=61207 RepID=A0A8A3PNT9_9HELO|nr:hypothetical protein DSL72_006464 [Monilinia vaccinii-corymbosi]